MTENPLFREVAPLPKIDQLLMDLYVQRGIPADQLPYTDDFEWIYGQLQDAGDTRTRFDVYRRLLNLRKSGRLPRVA